MSVSSKKGKSTSGNMNLILVESPAKAKTIAKYLNGNPRLSTFGVFEVLASMGHVRDLQKKGLGINIEAGFEPEYQVTPEKQKTVKEIMEKVKKSKKVWLASDYDREGEGIAMHLKEVLKLKDYHRITFTEITPSALEHAILHPRKIDTDLVDAQETRRILDRLVGFKLSPLLWKKYKTETISGLSAGRVQSAVLHLIIAREKEIAAFSSNSYWSFLGEFTLKIGKEVSVLQDVKLYKDTTIYKEDDIANVKALLQKIAKKPKDFSITDAKSRVSRTNADMPFITSSLQQEASSKLGFTLKRTMAVAQALYEKGYITYMRTDSYSISDDFKNAAVDYITKEYGTTYVRDEASLSKTAARKKKNAQEAHEAIRPTKATMPTIELSKDLEKDHKALYEMIWKRTIAYFMSACVRDNLDITIGHSSFSTKPPMYFLSTFSKVKFNGYMAVYGVKKETYDFKSIIDGITGGAASIAYTSLTAHNTWQSPPARFTESSIIKVLESEGIGRPSTYASIMGKLLEKRYVVKQDVKGVVRKAQHLSIIESKPGMKQDIVDVYVGQEKSKLVPSEIGIEIDAFLTEYFAYIVNTQFTANMEADLDRIAHGDVTKLRVLQTFWSKFGKDVDNIAAITKGTPKQTLQTASHVIQSKGINYTIRLAKYGPVIEYQPSTSDKKKSYIGIKPYMKMFKKDMEDINESDIQLLTSLPKKIAVIAGKECTFVYGPYGFYAKYDGLNVKLPMKVQWNILNNQVSMAELESAIEYADKRKVSS